MENDAERRLTMESTDVSWLSSDAAQRILTDCAGRLETPSLVTRLRDREGLSIPQCAQILEQLRVRQRATAKYPKRTASQMAGTEVGLEQSTDAWIAAYKADRLAQWRGGTVLSDPKPSVPESNRLKLGVQESNAPKLMGAKSNGVPSTTLADLCCGIGGDTVAFARLFSVTGVERDRYTAWAAQWNLAPIASRYTSRILCTDATTIPISDYDVVHIDPDRRSGGHGRTTYMGSYAPELSVLNRMRREQKNLIVKLAPGSVAPDDWATNAEFEWISRDRECRQQLVWFGDLTGIPGQRRATAVFPIRDAGEGDLVEIPSYTIRTVTGRAGLPVPYGMKRTPSVQEWIVEPDVSVLAANLTGEIAQRLHAEPLTPDGAYLTVSAIDESEWGELPIRVFERLEILPNDPGRLRGALKSHGIGRLEIKVRHLRSDSDSESILSDPQRAILGRKLKLRGDRAAVLFVLGTEYGERLTILAKRVPFPR